MLFSCNRMRGSKAILFAAATTITFSISATTLEAQSVGSSLIPSAQRVEWSDDLAFSEDWLYGGRVALRFGKFVELQPFYFMRDGYKLDSARAMSVHGVSAADRKLDLRHYGASVQLNLGSGGLVPFVRGGAGILRMDPDSAARQERITLSAGGGLRLALGGMQAELYAEQMGFRMNPGSLFGADTTSSVSSLKNLTYGAALTIPLSEMSDDDPADGRLRGSTAPIEPFVGELRYASEHGLKNQELAGVRAGIDFSPVFGVRGFYWRGLNEDRDGTIPVSGYGGEAQFNLNSGAGLSPFLIAGAGKIAYGKDFRDSAGVARDDKTAAILGAGASFRLTDRLSIVGTVRDYVMTTEENLDNVATTGDLTHNTMITGGLSLAFGGKRSPTVAERERQWERERDMQEMREAREERRRNEREERDNERTTERTELDRERNQDRERRMMNERERRLIISDTIRASRVIEAPLRGSDGDQKWITIPVPSQGEIILRFGTQSRNDSTVIVRDTIVKAPSTDELTARIAELERRLSARIDEANANRNQAAPQVQVPGVTFMVPQDSVIARDNERAQKPVLQRFGQTSSKDLSPYLAVGFGDGDAEIVAGLKADLGPITPGSGFRFVPEFAIGAGSGVSVLALANIQYPFGAFAGSSAVKPYVTLGAGIFSPTVLAVNTAVGTSFAIGKKENGSKPLFMNVELQGLNLFKHTRLQVGISRGR